MSDLDSLRGEGSRAVLNRSVPRLLLTALISILAAQTGVGADTAGTNAPVSSGSVITAAIDAVDKGQSNISQVGRTEKASLSAPVFIENLGQFDPKVKFQVKIGSKTAWLTANGIVFDAIRASQGEKPGTAAESSVIGVRRAPMPDRSKPEAQTTERLVFSEDFIGARCCSKVEGRDLRPGIYNYFQSRDPAKWRTNVRGYQEVIYRDVWPGIDLRIYGKGSDLEQEFLVYPGGDPNQVRISYRGIDRLHVSEDGSLEVDTAFGILRETKPRIYQQIAGKQVKVDGRFKLTSDSAYAFEIEAHDGQHPLVIDPTLLYSTYLGGAAGNNVDNYTHEAAAGIAVDASGNAYVTGYTQSTDFPITPGAFQTGVSSTPPLVSFVTKLNATGTALVYSTYIGGVYNWTTGIAVDFSGNAYVTGVTLDGLGGYSFPTTPNAYWPTDTIHHCTAVDYFVTKLNTLGNQLLYSTCLGSSGTSIDPPTAIAVDSHGGAFITGSAPGGRPTTSNAYQPSWPGFKNSAFVMAFDTGASGNSSLTYSTWFGILSAAGFFGMQSNAIALDSFGAIYIAGNAGIGLPTTPGAFQTAIANGIGCDSPGAGGGVCPDGFIAKFNPSASGSQSLIYSTYLGGPGLDNITGLAVDTSGNAYVAGTTQSTSFPVTPGSFQNTLSFSGEEFVAKLNAGGSKLLYSTYLQSTNCANVPYCYSSGIQATGIAVDSLGDAYVTGRTRTPLFPVTADAFQNTWVKLFNSTDYASAFLTKFNPTGSALIYSSYLGGIDNDVATAIAVDQIGDAYIAGYTSSANFPVTGFAFQPSAHGTGDAFVAKFPLGTNQTLLISSLTPLSGGNAGSVSPQIFGAGIHAGATAKLNCGGSTIVGANLGVGPEGRFVNTTFDLKTALPGRCDVVVVNPDGTSATLPQAFSVKQGGAPNVQIYLTGVAARRVPPEVGTGPADVLLDVTISNTGTVDAAGGFVYLPLNSGFTLTSTSPDASSASTSTLTATSLTLAATSLLSNSSAMLTIPPSGISFLRNLPSGQSQVVSSTATNPLSSAACSALWGPVCFTQNLADTVNCIVVKGAGLACLIPAAACTAASLCIAASGLSLGAATALCAEPVQLCLQTALDPDNPNGCVPVAQECITINASSCTSSILGCIVPTDPNNLVGPYGVGGQRWVAGTQGLTYGVSFNNEPTATAPAQKVTVTQALGSNVNLSTIGLPSITIPNGSSNVQVPVLPGSFNPAAGVDEFITNVDLRPAQSLLVNVDAKLNRSTQTLTWTFSSIDPATGLPPFNPLVGFLPAGAGANVSFSVTPAPGVATGTQVVEQATVVFDGQAPMSTPTWVNTIDNANPISHVSALATASTCPSFRVNWSGSDAGSGLQGFTIFRSDNGSPYTPWLSNTSAAAATYTGAVGHIYSFYSIATDLTGNVEGGKTSAEASTTVTAAGPCGSPSLSGQVLSSSRSGITVTVNLQLTNTGFTAAQAINISQITARTLSGSGTVTLSGPALPAAEGPLGIGASTTVTLTLNVPATVTRFSLTEGGNLQDNAGHAYSYSLAQTVIP
jgi:hypothetical protein